MILVDIEVWQGKRISRPVCHWCIIAVYVPQQPCSAHSLPQRIAPWPSPLPLTRCVLFSPWSTTHVASLRPHCMPWRRSSPSRCARRFAGRSTRSRSHTGGRPRRRGSQSFWPLPMACRPTNVGARLCRARSRAPPPGLCRLDAGSRRAASGIVALDGPTIRRSLDRADGQGPLHVVNAWASAKRECAHSSK